MRFDCPPVLPLPPLVTKKAGEKTIWARMFGSDPENEQKAGCCDVSVPARARKTW